MKVLYCRFRRKLCHWYGDWAGVSSWTTRLRSLEVLDTLRREFDDTLLPDIQVELNSDCNYSCRFCPQSSFKRPVQYMTRHSFLRLVGLLRELPYKDGILVLNVNNEPLLHPLFLEFCEIVSTELPGFRSWFITNGALLTEEKIRTLSSLTRPPDILVDDYTADHHIARHLADLLTRADMSSVVMREDEQNQGKVHYRLCGKMTITVWLRSQDEELSNRAGNQVVSDLSRVREYAGIVCPHPFSSLWVSPNLQTFLCCADYRYESVTGDLGVQSILEVWHGAVYRDIRAKMFATQRRDLPLCRRCDSGWLLGWRFRELTRKER